MQVAAAGTWGIYLASSAISFCFVRGYKFKTRIVTAGVIIFLIVSVIGPITYKEGSIVYRISEPEYIIKGYFNIRAVIASGVMVPLCVLPPIILYTAMPVFISRKLNYKYYEIIPYFIALLYSMPLLMKLEAPWWGYLWLWHILPFTSSQ
ncbi:MAG: hypothetical protein EPN25_13155 [Nitrospirae bacterium]|nr:MAG: hypothetical protein EPN25_13155 [Nitrospirota bacterium]